MPIFCKVWLASHWSCIIGHCGVYFKSHQSQDKRPSVISLITTINGMLTATYMAQVGPSSPDAKWPFWVQVCFVAIMKFFVDSASLRCPNEK